MRLIVTLVLLALLTSCASSRRMMRISPFEERMPSRERVNLWPFVYHDRDATSVLWPIVDWDNKGFAVRPLFNKEKDDYAILWPLSGWNPKKREGWILTGYWQDNAHGMFPLYHREPDDFNYITPVWWDNDDTYGVFPLFWRGRRGGALIPFWAAWDHQGNWDSGGLFPVVDWGRRFRHVGPFWYTRGSDGDWRKSGLFPLIWTWEDGWMAFPLYSQQRDSRKTEHRLLLGLGGWDNHDDATYSRSWLAPFYFADESPQKSLTISALWYRRQTPQHDRQLLFPFYYYEKSPERSKLVTPLFGRGWKANGDTTMTNIMGPVYHRQSDDTFSYTTVLWPTLEWGHKEDARHFSLLKAVQYEKTPTHTDVDYLFGLGEVIGDETSSNWRLWPLISYESQSRYSDPLYPLSALRLARLPHESTYSLLGPIGFSWHTRRPVKARHSYDIDFLLGGEITGDRDGRNWRLWPLISYESLPRYSDELYPLSILRLKNTEDQDVYSLLGPFGFSWHHQQTADAKQGSRQALLFFYHHYFTGTSYDEIPWGRTRDWQQLARRRTWWMLLWHQETEAFRVWQEGVITDEEMAMLDRWWRRQRVVKFKASPEQDQVTDEDIALLLARHGVDVPADDPAAIRQALLTFADAHTEHAKTLDCGIPLLSRYKRNGDTVDSKVLFGTYHYRRQNDRSHASLLGYLYRREQHGEQITRDFFPFFQWDSSPQAGHFAFLWRFFAIQHDNDKVGGHLLFIPWGDRVSR